MQMMKVLNSPFIRKGIVALIPYNDMIQYGNIQQNAAIPDLLGDLGVGFARLEVAAGMIVTQYNACGVLCKANLKDLLRINHSTRDTTFRNPDFLDDTVGLVQQQDPELLMRKVANQGFKYLKGIIAA